ncbi:unnamed protein product [Adineta ricciae]|uniref:FAD-binding FR-type domain-containing protein n=1 Tax=Adineta ricciae TaxID=249248 RepID=A0A815ZH08_ADIRI|nr:unnamed protein product [Adineta ricciae]
MSLQSIRLWFRLFLVNDLASILFLFIWLIINISLFLAQFLSYHRSRSYFYLRALIYDGVSIARASALCLNFNCLLILLPVCRNLLSLIRYLLPRFVTQSRFRRFTIRLFDQHVEFHRCVGYAICFWSLIHVGAHVYNYERFIDVNNEHDTLAAVLNLLYLKSPESQVNPVGKVNPKTLGVGIMFGTTAGITGVILCLCLILMVSSSTVMIRRSFYEIFWFTHHIFIAFFICLILHGIQGLVKSQTNLQEHNPDICAPLYREWSTSPQCQIYPRFTGSKPASWMWLCGPLGLYLLERILRFIRSLQHVDIVDVVRHESNVIEVRFQKKAMTTPQPGQYVYIKCFVLAKFEWHPFTVTSAAEEDYVSVHIRTVGNWTKNLAKKLEKYPEDLPRLSIDGPYGSPADDVFNYDGVVLVGAGIGVTPYASILRHIRSSKAADNIRLRRIYFYWICNTTACYEWFAQLLQELEQELRDRIGFLTYKIYLTQWSMREARAVIENNPDERDLWTGLQAKTKYGRPNFDVDFQSIADEDWKTKQRREIGVFVCGPKPLAKQLQKLCIQMNDKSASNNESQVYGILIVFNSFIVAVELSFTLYFLHEGTIYSEHLCTPWITLNYSLYLLNILLMAWTSIERYLFIYHEQLITQYRIYLHYIPILVIILYCPLFYIGIVVLYPCQPVYHVDVYLCGGACYQFEQVLGLLDWVGNGMTMVWVTFMLNVILIIRHVYQRFRMRRMIITADRRSTWHRSAKLSVQLLAIALPYMIAWIPYCTVVTIQIFQNTEQLAYLLSTFFVYFPYIQVLFLPYICILFIPEIKQKFCILYNKIWHGKFVRRHNQIHAVVLRQNTTLL